MSEWTILKTSEYESITDSAGGVAPSAVDGDEVVNAAKERCHHCALGKHIMSEEKDKHGNPIPDMKKARDVTCPGDCIVLELQYGVCT